MNDFQFSLDAYRFEVPKELIAQYPIEPRDSARLMIVDRRSGAIEEGVVADLPDVLAFDDTMIFNNTRVLHASLHGEVRPTSLQGSCSRCDFQCLLTKAQGSSLWWVMAKPARRLTIGAALHFPQGVTAEVIEVSPDGQRLLAFSEPLTPERLQLLGSIPLPPYIQRTPTEELDAKRYQTVYGSHFGSVAAPTAGLHFTESLLQKLAEHSVHTRFVTLHVGTGTFLPIRVDDIRAHQMHTESFEIEKETAEALNRNFVGRRRLAVGTTSCRVLETAAAETGQISPGMSSTNLFIYPGYTFRYVTSLLTNFHTSESSLLVLVSAFMGYELMREAYQKAIERRFRFFSYGDAMLIL